MALSDSVAMAIPCASGVEPRVLQSLLAVAAQTVKDGYDLRLFGVTDRSLIHSARNWLSKEFLATDCEWIFWADSDMLLPAQALSILMRRAEEVGGKFLTGVYYQRLGEHRPVLFLREFKTDGSVAEQYNHIPVLPKAGSVTPFRVDACGFGCVLMHRSVFDGAEYPYFKFLFPESGPKGDSYVAEDIYFCVQARLRGIDIWAVPELKLGHLGNAPAITRENCKAKTEDLKQFRVEAHGAREAVR